MPTFCGQQELIIVGVAMGGVSAPPKLGLNGDWLETGCGCVMCTVCVSPDGLCVSGHTH